MIQKNNKRKERNEDYTLGENFRIYGFQLSRQGVGNSFETSYGLALEWNRGFRRFGFYYVQGELHKRQGQHTNQNKQYIEDKRMRC